MFLVEDKIGIDWMKGRELKSRKKIILRLSTFIIIFFVFCLQYHQSGKISIELLDTETEGNNSDQEEESARKYSSYVERFISTWRRNFRLNAFGNHLKFRRQLEQIA